MWTIAQRGADDGAASSHTRRAQRASCSAPSAKRRNAAAMTSSSAWSCAMRVNCTRNCHSALSRRSSTTVSDVSEESAMTRRCELGEAAANVNLSVAMVFPFPMPRAYSTPGGTAVLKGTYEPGRGRPRRDVHNGTDTDRACWEDGAHVAVSRLPRRCGSLGHHIGSATALPCHSAGQPRVDERTMARRVPRITLGLVARAHEPAFLASGKH